VEVRGLTVLDVSMDQVRNRTIVSFTGPKDAIFEGGYLLYHEALEHIDMRQHRGEYPRIGAVDVFPFVALRNAPIASAVAWSVEFAEQVASRFQLPVYLFAESARNRCAATSRTSAKASTRGSRRRSPIRCGSPTSGRTCSAGQGATIIGARMPIVNFKAYFTTPDEEAARWVAEVLSNPATGMPGVHFYPALDRNRNVALLNITVGNYTETPLYRILEGVKTELRRFGSGVSRVEMVGLVPQSALLDSALHYLQVMGFTLEDTVEQRLDSILGE